MMLENQNAMRLSDLLSMQQDNTDPSVQYSTGQPSLSSLTRGRTEEEINKLLSGMQIRSPGFNPNFMSGEPYMPPQQMPQNYVQRGNNAPINMDQRQPMPQNYIQRGNNAPIDLGQSRRQHDVYADGPELLSRQQQPDGTFLVTKRVPARDGEGRMSSAVRQYIETPDYLNPAKLKEMQFKQAMQKLSEGNVDEQLKRAQLAELMGMDPAQMGGSAPVAQQQGAGLNQHLLQRRYGKAPPGWRRTANGELEIEPGGPADEKARQKELGATDVDQAIGTLRDAYNRLEEGGGITSTKNSGISNVPASIASSGLGQATGKLFGTSNQSARNDIAMTRPALLAALMKATGMSSKQMDSNAELKLWLATATDPTLDVESNRRALDNIEKKYIGARTQSPKGAAGKEVTMQDIMDTAQATGHDPKKVISDAKAKGYIVRGM